jgi:pimeloyl-ACP methyl ester carboxylesterase
MWKIVVFGILLIICALLALMLIVNSAVLGLKGLRRSDRGGVLLRIKKTAVLLASGLVLCTGFTLFTQWSASTPPIKDAYGNAVEGSVARLIQVELNGRREWISIRGHDAKNPVLLFLAGGPGGTQMAAVRYDLAELEKHFVVVNWDQPGSGKSYSAASRDALTPDTYIEDGYALTQYLCGEFGQEKIFLLGESWGSALGIFLVEGYPELYHAFIGTGQMVDFVETEITDYNLAMELALKTGNNDLAATLEKNGPPPYYGKSVTWKSAAYLNYLSGVMASNPEIQNSGYNTIRDLAAAEYGIWDKINFMRGIVNTFNQVYPQLYPIDLREGHTELQVPVYFFLGKHDVNAPIPLAEEYFESLSAPCKEIVWFEHSGHSPWINESDKFVSEVSRVADSVIKK